MSISTVLTLGFGSFGSVNKLPTLGYSIGALVVRKPDAIISGYIIGSNSLSGYWLRTITMRNDA